jgi:DUF1680 family protein
MSSIIKEIHITDTFWKKVMDRVHLKVMPYQWRVLYDEEEGALPSYAVRNFKAAAGIINAPHKGCVFQDTDCYKWIEAAAYVLMWVPDAELEKKADSLIDLITSVQRPDGYLDTYYILNGLEKRWTNLMNNHELYCLGHLIEAAVAYYEATGKRALMDAAIRFADHASSVIGAEDHKIHGYPGHPVAEMALVKLYECTKEERFLKFAEYFILQRGQSPLFFQLETKKYNNYFEWGNSAFQFQYYQAGKPVLEQDEAQGHAVRAMYLYSGMADIARLTGNKALEAACLRLWNSTVNHQMYITGAIGSSEYGEAFTFDYDLPNDTIYGETCAAIGLAFFARRMLRLSVKGEYADVMERALYNGIISGMSLDGERFFYVNPLEANPKAKDKLYVSHRLFFERVKWIDCACCPPNLARISASLGAYISDYRDGVFYQHLYIAGKIPVSVNGKTVTMRLEGSYALNGEVQVSFETPTSAEFCYAFRIPSWSRRYTIELNGEVLRPEIKDGYAYIKRVWQNTDLLNIHFDMSVSIIRANPRVSENIGKVAITRGPFVYCLEEKDNGQDLHLIYLNPNTEFSVQWEPDKLDGVMTINCEAKLLAEEGWDKDQLYLPYSAPVYKKLKLQWIPYYAWANRGENEMRVWVNLEGGNS